MPKSSRRTAGSLPKSPNGDSLPSELSGGCRCCSSSTGGEAGSVLLAGERSTHDGGVGEVVGEGSRSCAFSGARGLSSEAAGARRLPQGHLGRPHPFLPHFPTTNLPSATHRGRFLRCGLRVVLSLLGLGDASWGRWACAGRGGLPAVASMPSCLLELPVVLPLVPLQGALEPAPLRQEPCGEWSAVPPICRALHGPALVPQQGRSAEIPSLWHLAATTRVPVAPGLPARRVVLAARWASQLLCQAVRSVSAVAGGTGGREGRLGVVLRGGGGVGGRLPLGND